MANDLEVYFAGLTDKIRRNVAAVIREEADALSAAQRDALRALQQDPAETGDLEASCVAVPGENDLEMIVQAGGDQTTGDIREGSGVDFDHAVAFEYGTSRQPARPFFWPTYREREDSIRSNINQTISEALK